MEATMEQLCTTERNCIKECVTVNTSGVLQNAEGNIRVLAVYAEVTTGKCDILSAEAHVEGKVKCTAICIDEQNKLQNVIATGGFNAILKSDCIKPRSFITLAATAVENTCNIQNGSVNFKSMVEIEAIVITEEEVRVICDVHGNKMHTLTKDIEYSKTCGVGSNRFGVVQDLEMNVRMPEATKILFSEAHTVINEVMCDNDNIIVSGDVLLQVLYCCDDEFEPIAQIADRIEWQNVIECRGACPDDMPYVFVAVDEIYIDIKQNDNGENRVLACECILYANSSAIRQESTRIIQDIYSTTNMLDIDSKKLSFLSQKPSIRSQSMMQLGAALPKGGSPMARIAAVGCTPIVKETNIMDSGVQICGDMLVSVIYLAQGSGELCSFNDCIPWKCMVDTFEVEKGDSIYATVGLGSIQAALRGSSQADINITLNICINASNMDKSNVILSCTEGEPLCGNKCAISIYIVQPSDTLWSIARSMGVSMRELAEINNIEEDKIYAGQKLIVYRQRTH